MKTHPSEPNAQLKLERKKRKQTTPNHVGSCHDRIDLDPYEPCGIIAKAALEVEP